MEHTIAMAGEHGYTMDRVRKNWSHGHGDDCEELC